MSAQRKPSASLTAAITALTGGIFALDLFTPLGWADGFLYLLPLILMFRSPYQSRLISFTALCCVLIILGWIFSPPGGAVAPVTYNRSLGIALLWVTARFLRHRKQVEEALYLAQEENEERFTLLMDHANDAIAYLDLNGTIQWASLKTTVLTGRPMAKLVGSPVMSVLTPEAAVTAEARLAAVRRGEVVPPLVEFQILHPDGTLAAVEANITSVQGVAGVAGRLLVLRDITERKRAEQVLRESERRTRAILAGALDAVVGMDVQGIVTYWNPRSEVIFGWTRSEAVGRKMSDMLIPPQYREAHERGLQHFLATGSGPVLNRRIEITALRRDGTEFPVELAISVSKSDDSYQFTAFIADITERKRAEETIQENAKQIRAIFEQAPLGIAVINSHTGQFIKINEKYCTIAGFSEEEMLSRTFQDITHPKDLQADLNNMKLLLKGNIASFEMDKRYIRKDDSIVWVHLTVVPLWWGEEHPRLHLAMVEDITERRQAEEMLLETQMRLNVAVTSSNIGFWDWDLRSNQTHFSAIWKRQLGYGEQEITDRYAEWESRLHPDDRDRALAKMDDCQRNPGKPYEVEFRMRHKDGSYRWIFTQGSVLVDDAGKPYRMIGFHIDITDRKRIEEEHRQLYDRLQASHRGLRTLSHRLIEVQEQERRHLACELHDEIGQALTAVKINLQQAMHTPASPEAGTHLKESVTILDRTLQQVRNLSLDLRPSLLDDLGLVPTLKWLAGRYSQASKIDVHVSAEPPDIRPAPEIALACYRVAQEALTNAARHARANQINIELARSSRELVLSIRDNGIGFDITTVLSQAAAGDSVGLLGMQERVTLAGGEIALSSSPGQGTTICARFLLHQPGDARL